MLVGTIVLLPLATGELLNNVVNAPWWLFFATFWALLWRPRTPIGMIAAGAICFLSAGSDPLVGLFLPLAAARLYVLGWKDGAGPFGLALGLVYQVVGSFGPGQSVFSTASGHGIFRVIAIKFGLGWLTGVFITNHFVASTSPIWPVLGLLALLGVLAVAVVLRQRRLLVFVITSLGFAVVILVGSVCVRGVSAVMAYTPEQTASRYLAVPILLVWGAVIAEAVSVPVPRRLALRYVAIVLCCACLVPVWAIDFRTANGRTEGPLWNEQVARASGACRGTPTRVTQGLKISPTGWSATVPCSDL